MSDDLARTGSGTTPGSATLPDEAPADPPRRSGGFFRELPFLVVVAFGLALLIKTFLVQAFFIPSGSMEQTLAVSDRVLVNKLVYDVRDIRRGEVVVFNGEGSFGENEEVALAEPGNPVQRAVRAVGRVVGVGPPGEQDFIKRVVGLSGDRVACCDAQGRVTVQPEGGDPVALDESAYLYEDDERRFCEQGLDDACAPGALGILVPDGHLWVLGDHRDSSADSRAHIGEASRGMVPQDKVIGRAFVVVWPLDRASVLRVPDGVQGTALGTVVGHAPAAVPYALGLVGALPVAALRRRVRRRLRARV